MTEREQLEKEALELLEKISKVAMKYDPSTCGLPLGDRTTRSQLVSVVMEAFLNDREKANVKRFSGNV